MTDERRAFERITLIVLDSLGMGEMPDAAEWGDAGADTLGHICESRQVSLPTLRGWGLGNVRSLSGDPRNRSRRLSTARRGSSAPFETAIQSPQVAFHVRSALGARPGSARVEPLATITCHGSASSKSHWIVSGRPSTAEVSAERAITSK